MNTYKVTVGTEPVIFEGTFDTGEDAVKRALDVVESLGVGPLRVLSIEQMEPKADMASLGGAT